MEKISWTKHVRYEEVGYCVRSGRERNILLYKYTMLCQSNTTKLYYVYYCTTATCFDSYRIIFSPFYENRSLLKMFKNALWEPKRLHSCLNYV